MPTNCRQTSEFQKDFKKLARRYRTLADDLVVFESVITAKPLGFGKNFAILAKQKDVVIVKARLFCRSLKRNSLRIIYAYTEQSLEIKSVRIEFIELYFKGDKEREDIERIKLYLDSRLLCLAVANIVV